MDDYFTKLRYEPEISLQRPKNKFWGQFHEPKLSINFSELEGNLLPERKTREKVSIEILENSAG